LTEAAVAQSKPEIVRTISELRQVVAGWRGNGLSVALVPTMGALHAGHLALVRRAAGEADRAIVSIFVNPSQFGPTEDLARYPRDEAGDVTKLATGPCHLVWAPAATEMYPDGFATRVVPAGAGLGLESDSRPHFFAGVATVCCKLFAAAQPDVAVFGEKDYQQLCVVRQMVRDLNLPLKIIGEETVREADGLAMSSRNIYLSAPERAVAATLNRVLSDTAAKVAQAVRNPAPPASSQRPRPAPLVRDPRLPNAEQQLPEIDAICAEAASAIESAGFAKVDYVAVRDAETLAIVGERSQRALRVLAAAWLGQTRLIDNVPA
jgi:pantoate--beta-alanine ligase